MSRTAGVVLVFALVFIGVFAARAPLSLALGASGLDTRGVSWRRVEGTVWRGRVTGVRVGAQAVGDISLSLRPGSLLSGGLGYDVSWSGPPGRGAGEVRVSPGKVAVAGFAAEARIEELVGLREEVRRAGGRVNVRVARLELTRGGCVRADGEATTDALTRLAARYDRAFGELTADIRCEDGMLALSGESRSDRGDVVTADLRLGVAGPSSMAATAQTDDGELAAALSLLGFEYRDGAYAYRREAMIGGGL